MNYAQRAIERIGSEREAVVDRAHTLPVLAVPGFIDAQSRIDSGIYLLCLRGRITRICKVRKNFYQTVSALRRRPAILTPEFDQVLIRACHPDEIDGVYASLVSTYGAL